MVTDNEYFRKISENKKQAVLIRSEIEKLTYQFFFNKGFIFVNPPIMHEAITNKKAEIYFTLHNKKYSLSSSNALFMGLYASEFEKVFTISKCFRDESNTLNHLIEFNILEVEMLNCTFYKMLEIIKAYLKFILNKLSSSITIKKYSKLHERIKKLYSDFSPEIVTYDEFISKILKNNYIKDKDISDIDYLISLHLEKSIIIIDYPTKFATWTSKKKENGKSIAMNFLLPESYGELCEGCERTNDIKLLQDKINLANVKEIQWYIDSIKKVQVSRCGFGLGIDRLVRWIIGAEKISDIHFFPRIK